LASIFWIGVLGNTGNEDAPTLRARVWEGCDGGFAGITERYRVPVERTTGSAPGTGRWYAFTFSISARVVIISIDVSM
jgi:hypothetical protein